MEVDQSNFATDERRQQDGLLAITEMRARLSEDRRKQRGRNPQTPRQIPIIDAMDIGILGAGRWPDPRRPPRRLFSPLTHRDRIRYRLYGVNTEPEEEVRELLPRRSHSAQADDAEHPDRPPFDEYFLSSGRTRWNSFSSDDEYIQELHANRAETIRLALLEWLWCAYVGVSVVAVIVFLLLLVKNLCRGSYGSCLLTATQLGLVVAVYIAGAIFAGNQLSVDVLFLIAGMVTAVAAGQGLGFGG
ncbi:hypothetical protein PpBr36_03539 [Pyricularia pennisetigena]|uniref:hypothetical protein n=1 Tax=Pyricularia pennisetigena TaxID=1578925 RepID=UPI00114F13DD|nr:hypothetical protein PpBr36_03539 [Pyricularia pennisetigena]TLS30839.1 hypothetical protein PpBr36_03539 [Pyricularia pennisetigena]